jgi:PKD repeat protein
VKNTTGYWNSTTITNLIDVTSPTITSSFTASPTIGRIPLAVQFNDNSTGSPTSWNWSFGDGTYSDLQNPVKTFTENRSYTIMLNVTNAAGNNMTIKPDYIWAGYDFQEFDEFSNGLTIPVVQNLIIRLNFTEGDIPYLWYIDNYSSGLTKISDTIIGELICMDIGGIMICEQGSGSHHAYDFYASDLGNQIISAEQRHRTNNSLINQTFTISLNVFSSPNSTSSPSSPPDSYTKSLLHFNGASGSTTFTDETGKNWSAMGDAQLSTTDKKFGTGSLYLDGTGDYIMMANASSDYYLDGDFTIDYWAKMTKSPSGFLGMVHWASSPREFYVFTINANKVRVYTNGYYTDITVSTINMNTWYHWAFVRSGNMIRLYKDGVYQGSRTDGSPIGTATDVMVFGRDTNTQYFQGYVDELRVSKGIARWTSDFTPLSGEY